jgi:hypothetical protein
MSVRPVTVGEETYAKGHPWINILSTYGALQGVLAFLYRRRIPFQSNWLATPGSLPVFAVFVLGGYLGGGLLGMGLFSDWNIIRLTMQHKEDKQRYTDAHVVSNF